MHSHLHLSRRLQVLGCQNICCQTIRIPGSVSVWLRGVVVTTPLVVHQIVNPVSLHGRTHAPLGESWRPATVPSGASFQHAASGFHMTVEWGHSRLRLLQSGILSALLERSMPSMA
jgi:hypothetical protein